MPIIDNDAGRKCFKESNIPVLKKNHRLDSTKRPKEKVFLEQQKYVQPIIRTRNLPLKRNQTEAVNTLAVAFKTSQNKYENTTSKTKAAKNQMAEGFKKKITSTVKPSENVPFNGAVSTKNPRFNLAEKPKSDIEQCSTQEIENFLKKLYPNPYCLNEVNDFQNVRMSAQTVRYKLKHSSQGLKTSELLNMMFLKITDQSTSKLIVKGPETNTTDNNIQDTITSDAMDNYHEEKAYCLIEMNQNVLQCDRGEDFTKTSLDYSNNRRQIEPKSSNSEKGTKQIRGKEDFHSKLKLPCRANPVENEPENSAKFSKGQKPDNLNRARKESEEEQNEDLLLGIYSIKENNPRKRLSCPGKPDNDYNLGKLEILTTDKEPKSSIIQNTKEKDEGCLQNKGNFHPKKLEERKKREELEVPVSSDIWNRNFELLEMKNRSHRHKNRLEVRKLYDIVDKTTKSLQEITKRNEKEIMARREIEQINRQNAFNCKFENNKFIQFIRKMNRNENKNKQTTNVTLLASQSTPFPGESQNFKLNKPIKNSNKSKQRINKTLKNNKENEAGTNAIEAVTSPTSPLEKIGPNFNPDKKNMSVVHCNYDKTDNKKYETIETSFNLSEHLEIERRHFEFSESNRKIDEMLERMQQFIVKLDQTSSPGVSTHNSTNSISSLEKRIIQNDDFLPLEGNTTAGSLEIESGEGEREENRPNRRKDSFPRLLSVEETVIEPFRDHQTVENENSTKRVQMVDETNELAGYNEEKPEEEISTAVEVVPSKNSLPLSVRLRNKKTDSTEPLKKALEKEEKLLVNSFLDVQTLSSTRDQIFFTDTPSEPDFFSFGLGRSDRSTWTRKPTPGATLFFKSYKPRACDSNVLMRSFRRHNPNFVVCVNSLSANVEGVRRSTGFLSPFSSFVQSGGIVEERPVFVTLEKKQIDIENKPIHRTSVHRHRHDVLTINVLKKKLIHERSSFIGLKFLLGFSKMADSYYSMNPECWAGFELISFLGDTAANSVDPVTLHDNLECSSIVKGATSLFIIEPNEKNSEMNVGGLLKAVESTETSVHELELANSDSVRFVRHDRGLPWCSQSESFSTTRRSNSQKKGSKAEIEKTRVEELLMRTYNLQRKLHRHLHKMSGVPASRGSGVLPKVSLPDLCVLYENKTSHNIVSFDGNMQSVTTIGNESKSMQTDPLIPQTQVRNVSSSNVIDHGTSCHSFLKEGPINMVAVNKTKNETAERKNTEKGDENLDNCSSSSSFKSSNDFSEMKDNTAEVVSSERLQSSSSKLFALKNWKFLRKIFSDLEALRKCQRAKKEEKSNDDVKKEKLVPRAENDSDKVVSESIIDGIKDSKTSSRLLKTVFKGKDSTTELAIGLKDVPMRNISVEKKKFSPNHTKISISISKEESNKLNKPPVLLPTANLKGKRDPDDVEKRWEHLPLTCHSFEVQTLEMNGEEVSDNDEDDFKSVASSLSQDSVSAKTNDSDFLDNWRHVARGNQQADERKPFKKHRFDFYEKMCTDCCPGTTGGLLTRYDVKNVMFRELEPLKKALTDMQMKMRTTKRNSLLGSNEYYERALKLAKMSAGYCQCCGNRAVIPEDTFGYYKSVLPRRYSTHQLKYFLKNTKDANSGFYSFRSSTELSDHFCDLDLNHSSTYLMKTERENSVLETSLNNLYVTKNFSDF